MKIINYLKTILLLISAFIFAAAAAAQDNRPPEGPPPEEQRPAANQPQDIRANVLRQLGLSQEQFQQLRRMNAERKPLMDEAQKRFREANRSLDEAIYADQVSDADVQARLKEVQLAQAEVAKIRFMNELGVRRILTPEQLVRFRELRQRFEQARQNFENRRPLNNDKPVNRQNPGNDVRTFQNRQQPVRPVVRPNQQLPNF